MSNLPHNTLSGEPLEWGPSWFAPLFSEGRLAESLIRSSVDGILAYDLHRRVVLWNPSMERLSGISKQEVLGQKCSDFFPFASNKKFDDLLTDVLSGKSAVLRDGFFRHPVTGQSVFFESHHSALKDDHGRVIGGLAILRDVSGRRRAEEALMQAEQRFNFLLEAAAQIVYTVSSDGVITSVNPAFEQVLGWNPLDWIGKNFQPLVHPDDLERAIAQFQSVLGGEIAGNQEFRVITKLGETATLECFSAPMQENGTIVGVLGVARDITCRKRQEEERALAMKEQFANQQARANEVRYRQIAEAIPQIVWTATPDGKIDYRNERWEIFTGRSTRESLGDGWIGVVHPEDAALAVQTWKDAVAAGTNLEMHYRLRGADGTYRWHLVRAVPLRGDDGSIVKWFGSSTDIDDQIRLHDVLREREEQLRRSETRYRLVTRATNDAIWDWDLTTNVVERNLLVRSLFGYTEQDVLPNIHWWRENLHPEDKDRVLRSLEEAIARGDTTWRQEYRYRRKDGDYAYVCDRGYLILDESGLPSRMLGAMTDISESKRAEDELKRKTTWLARSNTALEQFAYVASHDLKEPLRMVKSYLQLLNRHSSNKLDQEEREYVRFAIDGASRMYALIDDLLAYSRVGTRGQKIQEVDCNDVLSLTLANLEPAIRESQASISSTKLPRISADRTQMVQLFQNLIANAIKFRSERQPLIHISAEQVNGDWAFAITDNGIGIEAEFAERIFVIFQRLHTREKYPGTGIGLAICKKIVEHHGGQIWVSSTPGVSSTFHFTVPVTLHFESR